MRRAPVRKVAVVLKKVLAFGGCAALAIALAGCGGQASGGSASTNGSASTESVTTSTEKIALNEEKLFWLTYGVPADWEKTKSGDDGNMYGPSVGGLMYVTVTGSQTFSSDLDSQIAKFVEQSNASGQTKVTNLKKGSDGAAVTYQGDLTRTEDDGVYKGFAKYTISGSAMYMMLVCVPEEDLDSQQATLDAIADSMHVTSATAPNTGSSSDTTSQQQSSPSQSTTQQNSSVIKEGMYRVGSDIEPGEYKLTATRSSGGYWEVTNSSSADADIVGNDNFSNSTYVTVSEGQYLKLSGCTAEKVQ